MCPGGVAVRPGVLRSQPLMGGKEDGRSEIGESRVDTKKIFSRKIERENNWI